MSRLDIVEAWRVGGSAAARVAADRVVVGMGNEVHQRAAGNGQELAGHQSAVGVAVGRRPAAEEARWEQVLVSKGVLARC